jgi:hypothetical protein
MRRGILFGRDVQMAGSPLALLYFREEFDTSLPSYISEIYKHKPLDCEEFLRVAWALAKVCDKDIPSYEEWLDEFPDEAFSLLGSGECISVIDSVIAAEMFRG